ncbi:C40 family peptidase [Actinoplanes sp. NPDC020271]|uniref:C40 family peptidase n=1 Tax=Actinoplanes sp. NPDC020271 TaxID=3363896 RepID=UPI00379BE957
MLTAGALALAVIAPAVDPAEHATEASQAPQASSANPEPPVADLATRVVPGGFDPSLYEHREQLALRATRSLQRRAGTVRPAPPAAVRAGAAVTPVRRSALGTPRRTGHRASQRVERGVQRQEAVRQYRAPQRRVVVAQRRITVSHRGMVRKSVRRTVERPLAAARGGQMSAVIAYARSQLGRRYVTGGEGRGGFDCSGLTRQAYARAGMRLPHSSRAQAARARTIPRGQARPGDLVVGHGHVGIYMGRGMMIDAGNHRTGVVYRKLYHGLQVKRIR